MIEGKYYGHWLIQEVRNAIHPVPSDTPWEAMARARETWPDKNYLCVSVARRHELQIDATKLIQSLYESISKKYIHSKDAYAWIDRSRNSLTFESMHLLQIGIQYRFDKWCRETNFEKPSFLWLDRVFEWRGPGTNLHKDACIIRWF